MPSESPNDQAGATPDPTPGARAGSRRGWRGRWWLAIPAILLIIVAALPTILGSKWFYQSLIDRLAIQGFRLRIDSAEIGWFRHLALRGVRLEQVDAPKLPRGERAQRMQLLSIEAIESDRSLLGYLLGGRQLGRIRIVRPEVDIELLENTSNLEKLVDAVSGSTAGGSVSGAKSRPAVDLDILIEGFSVSVVGKEGSDALLVVPPWDAQIAYLASQGPPRIVVSPTRVLDHVTITQELVRLGLGRAIPLLAKSAWFDGSVSLATDRLEIPLDTPERASGSAVLTLHEVRTGPSEPVVLNILDMIAKFRGREPVHELVFIDGSEIQLAAADGMLHHDGVQVGLPRIDPRLQLTSAGSVGIIDQSLDLRLGLPVPLEMLARRESVQQLGVPQIGLPIRGTIERPVVDWQAMRTDSADLLSVISAALGDEAPGTAAAVDVLGAVTDGQADEAIGAAVDLIKELRRLRQERRARSSGSSPDEASKEKEVDPRDATPPPRRPLRDALRNLRGG